MEENTYQKEAKEVPMSELVKGYTRYWYLFVLGIVLAMSVAYLYLRYTTFLYETKSTIVIRSEKSGEGSPLEMLGLSQFSGFLSKFSNGNIDNELVILKSRRLISKTVEELGLNINYETVGAIKSSEIYSNLPFTVKYLTFKNSENGKNVPELYIKILSTSEYHLENESQSIESTHKFGEKVSLPFGDITVLPNQDNSTRFQNYIDKTILISYRPVANVASGFRTDVVITNVNKSSNVLDLSILSPVPEKSEDFLNELVRQYNIDAAEDKNEVGRKSSEFINERLRIITNELDSVESNKASFKTQNKLTDIASEAQMALQGASAAKLQQYDISTQLELSNSMIDYMENSSENELLPANIGIQSPSVNGSVVNYNQLILYRNKLLQTSTSKNPVVKNVNDQIEQMRASILSSLKNSSDALKISMKDLNIQESSMNSKIARVPGQEKIFRGIERQQTIKEQLYLFLLTQRESASITLAATSPKAKVVDYAHSSGSPVSPKTQTIWLGAFFAGLFLPFIGIFAVNYLDNKVSSRRDVENHFDNTPIIGEIPKIKRNESELIQHNDRSIMAESFRILRTNLHYLFVNKDQKDASAKTIIVTSTIMGEGKTFVAFNLALALAQTGKKVILVGADIRNPQLQRYLSQDVDDAKGLTEYIVSDETKLQDIIIQSEHNENLDIILSGTIPPNPAELLMQDKTATLINKLKEQFDYVIMDSAPAMLVTDSIIINKLADVTLYVVRAGYTDKRLLDFPQDAINDGRLANVAIVMNNVELDNFGYGAKYGYAYTDEEKTFWQRLFNK